MILEETEQSKIFDNEEFGHRKVAVERPLSMEVAGTHHAYRSAEIRTLKESGKSKERGTPTIKKVHRRGSATNWLYGLDEVEIGRKSAVIEYEPDSNLRATENSIDLRGRNRRIPHTRSSSVRYRSMVST